MDGLNSPESCLRSIPGQVIALRRRREQRRDEGRRSTVETGSVVDSFALELPSDAGEYRSLDLIRTPPGLELRYLNVLQRNPNVLATSLHYTGQVAQQSAESVAQAPGYPSWVRLTPDLQLQGLADLGRLQGRNVVLTVDVSESHTKAVLTAAAKAANYCERSEHTGSLEFVGIRALVQNNLIGLYEYAKAFAQLSNILCNRLALIMPVDFGRACLHSPEGQKNPVNGAAAFAAYSIPVLELALRISLRACARRLAPNHRGYRLPAVFAAAGNREPTGQLRHRLAYPALRPECIAVTHCISVGATRTPNASSDLPLSHDTKPVFALDEAVAKRSGAETSGTSFAAPWYATWALCDQSDADPVELLGPFARQARAISMATPIKLIAQLQGRSVAQPAFLVGDTRKLAASKGQGLVYLLVEAVSRVNDAFDDAEFAITGSAATLAYFQSVRSPTETVFSRPPSDIDVVYASESPLSDRRLNLARTWFQNELRDIVRVRKLEVDIQDIDGRVAPLSLCQCIVPSTAMFITEAGLLDVWGGAEDLDRGKLRVIMPSAMDSDATHPQAIVERFAQFPSLLIALNSALRLHEVASKLAKPTPMDLAEDYSHVLQACIQLDGVHALSPATLYRLQKLAGLLPSNLNGPAVLPPYVLHMLRVLKRWIEGRLPSSAGQSQSTLAALLARLRI